MSPFLNQELGRDNVDIVKLYNIYSNCRSKNGNPSSSIMKGPGSFISTNRFVSPRKTNDRSVSRDSSKSRNPQFTKASESRIYRLQTQVTNN